MRQFNITVNGVAYQVSVEEVGAAAPVAAPVAPTPAPAPVAAAPVAAPAPAAAPAAPVAVAGGEKVSSPMPGTILDIKVNQGDAVKKGTALMILEAMKMENEIMSPCDGTVKQIGVSKGASVNSGDLLAVIG